MLHRRDLLKASSLLPFAPTLGMPDVRASAGVPDPILVVIELGGGNDGVNTIIPFRDPGYAQHRRKIGLPRKELLTIDDELGMHPALGGFAKLLERGELGIVQGVNYPELELSHEAAMAKWHTARFDRAGRSGPGWIGRMLDQEFQQSSSRRLPSGVPGAILAGPQALPGALRARRSPVATIPSLETYLEAAQLGSDPVLQTGSSSPMEEAIRRILVDAHATAERLQEKMEQQPLVANYPSTRLGASLRLIGQLIRAELQTPVYYAIQTGYDTHAMQPDTHARLLTDLADTVLAFLDDVRAAGLHDRVVVMAFSEFGRRVPENASHGTDHGTAGPVFLAGAPVLAGVHGRTPSLTDLDDGNLRSSVDPRRIYASLLEHWFQMDATIVLGGKFEPLACLRS